jgi:glycosyltransferase involved in cell wall biosynthesis
VTGIPEIVRDNETGLIVNQHDPASLADGIERLLDDEALAERLATTARQLVEAQFDIHRNTVSMRELFRTGMPEREPVTLEVG